MSPVSAVYCTKKGATVKKFVLVVAAAISIFASASSADPLAHSLSCPSNSCFVLAPAQTTFLGVPLSIKDTSDASLAEATTLLVSASSPPAPSYSYSSSLAAFSPTNDALVANPLDPTLNSLVPPQGIGAAEPPTLLLLATGLFFVSVYRKHAATRRSQPPHFTSLSL